MPKRKRSSRGLLRTNDAVLRHCLSFLPAPDLLRSVTRVNIAFARLLRHRQAWPTAFTFEFVRPGGITADILPGILQRLARIGGFVDMDLSADVVKEQVREHKRNRVTVALRSQRVVLS